MHWTDVKSLQVSLKKYDLENLDVCMIMMMVVNS